MSNEPTVASENSKVELADNSASIGPTNELTDVQLVERITRREIQYKKGLVTILEESEKNRKYYRGDQIETKDLYDGETPQVVNKIFQGVETIVPLATKKTPDPNVVIRPITAQNNRLKKKLYQKLREEWEVDQHMPLKMQSAVRNLKMSKFAVFKYFFDEEQDDFSFKLLPTGKVLFPVDCTDVNECPSIIEYVEITLKDAIEKFRDYDAKIDEKLRAELGKEATEDSTFEYIEYWEDTFFCCKYKDIVLFRGQNPNWNYEEDPNKKAFNHFKHPEKPYIFLNHITFGDKMIDETTEVEQSLSLQDGINKRKRQIELSAGMASGKIVVAGNKMSREEFELLSNDPDQKIYLDDQDSVAGAVDVVLGRQMDQSVYADMADSKSEIDNTMGTHSSTRGERDGQETASGRVILKESDTDRIGGLSTRIEFFSYWVFRAMLQMMFVYYDEQHPVHFYDNENDLKKLSAREEEVYLINTEFKNKFITILVKGGSTLPDDTFARKAEAVELWKNKGMSTVDMYRILDYPNPEQLARNAYLENNNPQALYEQLGDDSFQIDAIEHIRRFIDAEALDEDLFEIFQSNDVNLYEKHITTHLEYLKGTEVDPDLIPYESLDTETQRALSNHIMMEKTQYDQLIIDEQNRLKELQQTGGMQLPPELMQILGQVKEGEQGEVLAEAPIAEPPQAQLPLPAQNPVGGIPIA